MRDTTVTAEEGFLGPHLPLLQFGNTQCMAFKSTDIGPWYLTPEQQQLQRHDRATYDCDCGGSLISEKSCRILLLHFVYVVQVLRICTRGGLRVKPALRVLVPDLGHKWDFQLPSTIPVRTPGTRCSVYGTPELRVLLGSTCTLSRSKIPCTSTLPVELEYKVCMVWGIGWKIRGAVAIRSEIVQLRFRLTWMTRPVGGEKVILNQ
jgi:hypothetical protein